MPCMGPTKPSREMIEEIYLNTLKFLREKYGILDSLSSSMSESMINMRIKRIEELKIVLSDLAWQDACEKF